MRKFFARAGALVILIGVGALASPASPAHAVIGVYRVTATSAMDSISPKSVTASCNAGDDVLNVSGRINDANGDVLLTRAYTDAALNSGTAWGIEAIATGDLWEVQIFLTCAPAGAVPGIVFVQSTSPSNAFSKAAQAWCPAGTEAFGGGYYLYDAWGMVAIDDVNFSSSLSNLLVTTYNYGAPGNYTVTAQVICGNPVVPNALVTWTSASNSLATKSETSPSCPPNSEVSAVGGYISNGFGYVSMQALVPKPLLTAVEVTAKEIGTYTFSWELDVQGICVT